MRNLRLMILTLLFLLPNSLVFAQESLSLEQAVDKALAGNREVQAAEFDRIAAGFGIGEAVSHYLPHVSLQAIHMQTNNPVMAFGTSLNQGTFSLQDFQMNDPNEPDVTDDYITRIEGTQAIFGGGKIITGIYQASRMYQAQGFARERKKLDVEYSVSQAYYNALRAQRFVALTDQVIKTMERHVKTAKDYYAQGMVLESDALQAEVYLAQAKLANVEANNNFRLALANLNFLLGVERETKWVLSEPPSLQCVMPDREELIREALNKRQDLQAMTRKVSVASAEQGMAATGFIPTIGLKAEYDFHDEEEWLGDQAEDWTVYLMAKWDIFDGGRDVAKIGKAVYEAKAAKTRLAQMREGIALEVTEKFLNLDAAQQKFEVASATVKQAERAQEIQSNRFESGLLKISDLLDAQTDETKAKTNKLNATYDLILAKLALRHSVGDQQCGPDYEQTTEGN